MEGRRCKPISMVTRHFPSRCLLWAQKDACARDFLFFLYFEDSYSGSLVRNTAGTW